MLSSIFRYLRNKRQRREAREEQLRAIQSRVEFQVFHTRCSHSPEVLTFHPFEPHLAVALKDFFGYNLNLIFNLNFNMIKFYYCYIK